MPPLFRLGQHSALSAVVAGFAESPSTQARPRCGTKVAPVHPIAQPDPISSCAPSTRRRQTNSQQPTTVVCSGV